MRKIRKIKYSKLFLVTILAYILFKISINIMGKNVDTLVLESEVMNLKITEKGLIIRDEYLIKSNQNGELNSIVKEGEKLRKGDTVATIYKSSNIVEENKKKIDELNKEIKKLQIEYENSKSNLSKELIKVNIKTKKDQKAIINNSNNKNINYLYMPTPGVVSNKYDGYENIYTLDSLKNLTYEDIENTENNYKDIKFKDSVIKESEVVARIIKSDYSYIAICTDNDTVLEKNQKVEILFDNDNIEAIVENIYINGNYNLIIFKLSNQKIEIYDTRVKEFDIIYKKIDGLKIPKKSIEEVSNQKGVYVLNQQTRKVDFVELKTIQYENDEFVFIDYYKNKNEGIKTIDMYDEIILNPNIINKNIKLSRW